MGMTTDSTIMGEATTTWTVRRMIFATLVALGIGLLFWLFYRFYMVIFILFVAITLHLAIKPIVDWMKRHGVAATAAVLLTYLLLLFLFVGSLWFAAPMLASQLDSGYRQIPEYYHNLRTSFFDSDFRFIRAFAHALPADPSFVSTAVAPVAEDGSESEAVLNMIISMWAGLKTGTYIFFVIISIFMLAYYWTLESDLITRRTLLLVWPEKRPKIRAIINEMEEKIGSYFRGQAILCAAVGVLSIIGYFAIGLPYALALGLFMAVMEAIPMVGPLLGAIPALLVALSLAPDKLLWVIGVVSIIQLLENNLLVPKIMDQSVGINAIVTILAISAFGILFGIGGAILAIPLAAIMQILFDNLVMSRLSTEENVNESANTVVDRGKLGALRVEAQDLYADLRKAAPVSTASVEENERLATIEDSLEAIAQELDLCLSHLEQRI